MIAQIGSGVAPGTTANFLTLSDPVYNNNGAVAFRGTLKVGAGQATSTTATGIWKGDSAADLALVAQQGGTAPGTGGATFSGFTSLGVSDSGGAVILATLNSSKTPSITAANNVGIWEGNTTSNLHRILQLGENVGGPETITKMTFLSPSAYVGGQTRSFNSTSGDIVCGATLSDHTTAIVKVVSGTPQVVAQIGRSVASNYPEFFASFGSPVINDNDHVAFAAAMIIGTGGIDASDNLPICADDNTGTRQFVTESGNSAPGTMASFLTFDDPVYNNNQAVAFRATLNVAVGQATSTTATGIWCTAANAGSLALVARQGESGSRLPQRRNLRYVHPSRPSRPRGCGQPGRRRNAGHAEYQHRDWR